MTAEERILESGFEDVIIFSNYSFDDALIGVSEDYRAVYDFDLMVEWLMNEENISDVEAIEYIEYNTIRSLPYIGDKAPIIMYKV